MYNSGEYDLICKCARGEGIRIITCADRRGRRRTRERNAVEGASRRGRWRVRRKSNRGQRVGGRTRDRRGESETRIAVTIRHDKRTAGDGRPCEPSENKQTYRTVYIRGTGGDGEHKKPAGGRWKSTKLRVRSLVAFRNHRGPLNCITTAAKSYLLV